MSESHDFFALERRIQDRLVASLRREATPIMLARAPLPSRRPLVVLALLATLGLGIALFVVGLGRVASPVFRHPPATIAAHLAWLVVLGASLLVMRRKQRSARALPLPLGRFLFSSGVLDVTAEAIRFRPLVSYAVSPLASPKPTAGHVVTCKVGTETIRFEVAEAEISAVHAELEGHARALLEQATETIEAADPLHLPRYLSPIAPLAPYAFVPTFAERRPLFATLVWAAPLAGLLFVGREVVSDELAFRDARAHDDVGAYAAYAARGKAHVSAVRRTHLPRAALRQARAFGTVEAIESFRADFPATDIEGEVAEARGVAVRADLARAESKGELAALREHARRFPNEAKVERDAAIAAHYTRARTHALARVPAHDPSHLGAAIAALYRVPSAEPPSVRTEARADAGTGLDLAERAVTRTITWNGKKSLPTAFLTEKELASRANASATVTRDLLRATLESDAVPFGDASPEPSKGNQASRLVVTRRVDWSGRVFTAMKPRVAVAGINVSYEASLVLPSGAVAWTWKTSVSEGVNAAQIKKDGASDAMIEARLYGDMQDAADKTFQARLKGVLEAKSLHASKH